jgi:DNA polymerase V
MNQENGPRMFGVAQDFSVESLSLDRELILNPEATFFVRCGGRTMEPFICEGDLLLVDRSLALKSGDIATFFFNNEACCRIYIKESQKIILRSYNPQHKDIVVGIDDSLEIFGVVTNIIRTLI